MAKVLCVLPINEQAITLLEEHGHEVITLKHPSLENILAQVVDVSAIIVKTTELPREVIDQAKKLKVIARHGIGVDNIDVETATRRGIYVTNAPESNMISTAEHVITLLMALAKNIRQSDIAIRENRFQDRNTLLGLEIYGKVLSIIGLGRVGQKVALIASRGLGMQVLGYDPYRSSHQLPSEIKYVKNWEEIFRKADFVSLNLPLTEKTRGLVGRRELALMKKTAYLINCSRGDIINEEEVAISLREKIIAGGAFDVFSKEPPQPENPLLGLDNALLTPHVAGLSRTSMLKMALHAAQGVLEVLNNQKPTWPVNQPIVNCD